jgi:hypothetical protein
VGLEPSSKLGRDFAEAGATLALVLGAMLAIGGVVVGSAAWAVGASGALVGGWVVRRIVRGEGVRAETDR